MTHEATIWGIHGGRYGDADGLFKSRKVIALGWAKVPDLRPLKPNREAFKEAVLSAYPDKKAGALPVEGGQLFRFVHEAEAGDFVVWPSKADKLVHIGRIEGPYVFDQADVPQYPHRRPVTWLKSVPRTAFSQGALYEIGSAMSFFQVKTYAEEYIAAVEGKPTTQPPTKDDETVAVVAQEIELSTRDFVLKTLAQELKGHPFAYFVGHLLEVMGYRVRISPEGPDGGVDIIAHRDELGFEPPIIKVQVKSTEGTIGDPVASALYGKLAQGEFALLVTLGTFSPPAKVFARSKGNLRLIDGDELVALALQHYDKFDSRYKAILPLKRVYVPDPEPSDEGAE